MKYRWWVGLIGILLWGCAEQPGIPDIQYDEWTIRGIVRWVHEWVVYEPDLQFFYIRGPVTTYEMRFGNCEAMTALAMYLVHRDLGLEPKMAANYFGRWHAYLEVDGKFWDVTSGWQIENEPLFSLDYETVMELATR